MPDKRQVELDMLARDRASREIDKVGDSARRAGDGLKKMEGDAKNLDRRILESQQHIQQLARDYAAASDDVERHNIFKQLRSEQAKMRKDVKARDLLPDPGEMTKAGSLAGSAAGQGIMSSLADTLRAGGPVGTAFGVGIGMQVAAVAAPFIAATISGAILTGVGAGAIGIGAMLLKEDGQVKAAAGHLGSTAKTAFTDAAQPMVGPLVDSMGILESSARRLAPQMQDMFAGAAPGAAKLARGIAGLAENALPGLTDAAGASDDAMSGLEQSLPQLGADIGTFFSSISEGSNGAAQGISDLVTGVGTLIRVTGYGIEGLSKMYGAVRDFEPPQWMKDLTTALLPFTPLLNDAAGAIAGTKAEMKDIKSPADQAAEAFRSQAGALDIARLATEAFRRAQDESTNANLSAAEAALAYRGAVKTAADAVDHKRRVSNQEESALLSLARAGNADITVMENQNATGAQLSARHEKLRGDFIATAIKMGYTKAEAKKLADQYLKIPKSVNTTAKLLGYGATIAELATIKAKLKALNGTTAYYYVVGRGYGAEIRKGTSKGGTAAYSDGGLFRGTGTSTSDSNEIRVSDREFIVNAASTARPGVLPLLEWINSGARGNAPALPQAPASARPARATAAGGAPAFTAEDMYRAMVRALRAVPVIRYDAATTADLYARGG